jgi:hypothetical protein
MLYRLRPTSASHHHRRRYRSARRHFDENGTRCAVLRAITAAELYLGGKFNNMTAAARGCGSNEIYIAAAVTVLQTEDTALKTAVLNGTVNLFAAAKAMKQAADLLSAYRAANSSDKFAVSCAVSVGTVWDEMIVPVLDDAEGKEFTAV